MINWTRIKELKNRGVLKGKDLACCMIKYKHLISEVVKATKKSIHEANNKEDLINNWMITAECISCGLETKCIKNEVAPFCLNCYMTNGKDSDKLERGECSACSELRPLVKGQKICYNCGLTKEFGLKGLK